LTTWLTPTVLPALESGHPDEGQSFIPQNAVVEVNNYLFIGFQALILNSAPLLPTRRF
jgi:hypothetical protein